MRASLRIGSAFAAAAAAILVSATGSSALDRARTVVVPPQTGAPADGAAAPLVRTTVDASPAPGASPRGELTVTVDRAKVIRLPERVQTVILGNPSIADIAVQKNGLAVLTGKSYGVTNLIALDSGGNMLAESVVSVMAPSESLVTVQRGLERQSLSCTPSCQPTVVLGDALTYFSDTRGQADQHRQFSTQR